jgi:acyl carrier protein
MTEAQIYEALNEILHDLLGDEEIRVGPTTRGPDLPDWSSIIYTQLTVAVEERFGFRFTTGETEGIKTFGDLVKRIQHRLGR